MRVRPVEPASPLFRRRLEEVSQEKYVCAGKGAFRLRMDLHQLRSMGITINREPFAWRRFRRSGVVINCIAYALGMHASDIYLADLKAAAKSGRKSGFAPELAEPHLDSLQNRWRRKPSPAPGDLVVYCDGPQQRIKHAGMMLPNGRVRSKWGSLPGLFEHRLWDVPSTYGDSVQFYRPVPLVTSEAFYRKFVI